MKSTLAWLLCVLFACSGVSPSRAECLDDIRKAGVMTSGNGVMGMKPYVWQTEDGVYTGMEWDLFQEVGKRIGVPKVEYITTEWPSLIPGLKARRWDIIISSMSVTQEREQGAGIVYTRPYFILYDYLTVLDKSPVHSLSDMKGKTVASMLGTLDSLNAHMLQDDGAVANVLDFSNSIDAFKALRNGQADGVILSQATLHAQNEMLHDVRAVGEPIYYHAKPDWAEAEAKAPYILGGTAIGVRKDCPALLNALNTALLAMEADGTRKAIVSKYGLWSEFQTKLMK